MQSYSSYSEPSSTNDDPTVSAESREIIATSSIIDALIEGDYSIQADTSTALGQKLQRLIEKLGANARNDLNRVVDLSINNNEASIAAAQLLYDLKNVAAFSQRIASAAEEMRASVGEVKQYSESIDQGTTNSFNAVEKVLGTLGKAVETFDEIKASVAENSAKLTGLTHFTKQVRDISDQIKGIAFQSNILSMNASVEAARAGDQGRGFGVIAQEIHLLSGRSEDATAQITKLINNYESEVAGIMKSLGQSQAMVEEGQSSINLADSEMNTMVDQFKAVSENTSQISLALSEQSQASEEVAKGINTIAMHSDKSVASTDNIVESIESIQSHINQEILAVSELNIRGKIVKLAQSDHVIWKKRLVNMIAGKEGLSSHELADHHSCRLGLWYDKVNTPELRSHPAFAQLEEPHRLVHAHGKRSVDLYNAGNIGMALQEIQKVEQASRQVLALLRKLEHV
ncbi:MAG: methyl-accepting chemotaxis protein [Glaciecola sp.]|jgi:methyl-accepting chemotaxis protein